jgi:hypothetical protein
MQDPTQSLQDGDFLPLFLVTFGVFVVIAIVTGIVMRAFMLVTGPNDVVHPVAVFGLDQETG